MIYILYLEFFAVIRVITQFFQPNNLSFTEGNTLPDYWSLLKAILITIPSKSN